MRSRIFAVAVIAILAGGTLAFATYSALQRRPAGAVSISTQPVVIAAADLSLGAELKAEDLRIVGFPLDAIPTGVFATVEEIVGRGLITSVVMNEPILAAKLASKEAGHGLPPVIPQGMRAVSVKVNEVVGVAGYVLPGTRVDVVATASPTSSQTDMTSKVVLANVQVVTAGTRMEKDQDQGKAMPVTVVTLLVTPEQAERLALASTEGKIQLALRNPLDQGVPDTPGIKSSGLLGSAAAVAVLPAPRAANTRTPAVAVTKQAAPPVEAPSVEIIRGAQRSTEIIR